MTMGRCAFVLCDSMVAESQRGKYYGSPVGDDESSGEQMQDIMLCRPHAALAQRDRETRIPWVCTSEGWVYPMFLMDLLFGYGGTQHAHGAY